MIERGGLDAHADLAALRFRFGQIGAVHDLVESAVRCYYKSSHAII
jgi:hypothetical protein